MTICCCCHIGGPAEVSDADLPPARSNLAVTGLTRKDEAEAVRVGSAGFAGNGSAPGEPVQAWVLGGDPTGALPTAGGRQAHIDYIIRCSFLQAQSFGGVVLGAKLDGQLAGIAIAYPPGRMVDPGSSDELCMFGHICCCKMSCATPPNDPKALHMSSVKPRFAAFEKAMKSEALAAVWRPLRKQYWKLEVIAVDAPCRGQGVGTALVQAVHHLADKDGAPTYVEFAGEQLLSFYTKQGFGEHDASCDLEHGGSTITMYARVRNGNGSNGAAVVEGGSSAKVAPDTMARS